MGGVGVQQAAAVELVLQLHLGLVVQHPPGRVQQGLLSQDTPLQASLRGDDFPFALDCFMLHVLRLLN